MTNQEIKDTGLLIKNEQHIGGNTAGRVGGVIEGIGYALDNKDAANGYYQATINGGSISVNAPNYVLGTSGNLRIKMPAAGTTASTLTIGNANAVQLWYNGAAVSAQNTWEANEIISVFYDGTRFMASNSQGGGGKAEKIKYDNSQSGLAAENVQEILDKLVLSTSAVQNIDVSEANNIAFAIDNTGKWIAQTGNGHYSKVFPIPKGVVGIILIPTSATMSWSLLSRYEEARANRSVPIATGLDARYLTNSVTYITELSDATFICVRADDTGGYECPGIKYVYSGDYVIGEISQSGKTDLYKIASTVGIYVDHVDGVVKTTDTQRGYVYKVEKGDTVIIENVEEYQYGAYRFGVFKNYPSIGTTASTYGRLFYQQKIDCTEDGYLMVNINSDYPDIRVYKYHNHKNDREIINIKSSMNATYGYKLNIDTSFLNSLTNASILNGVISIASGGVAKSSYEMFEDEVLIETTIKPTSDTFDIRFGRYNTTNGTLIGLRKNSESSYLDFYKGTTRNGSITLDFSLENGVEYFISIKKITCDNNFMDVNIVSNNGYNYHTLLAVHLFGEPFADAYYNVGYLWGTFYCTASSGSCDLIELNVYSPYNKECKAVVIGHSFVEGNSIAGMKMQKFSKLLQSAIGIENCGIFGKGGGSMSDCRTLFREYVSAFYRPKYVLICTGTNDNSMTLANYKTWQSQMAALCAGIGATPVFFTIPPDSGAYEGEWNSINSYLREGAYKYIDMDKCFTNEGTPINGRYIYDRCHPNAETHRAIFNRIKEDVPDVLNLKEEKALREEVVVTSQNQVINFHVDPSTSKWLTSSGNTHSKLIVIPDGVVKIKLAPTTAIIMWSLLRKYEPPVAGNTVYVATGLYARYSATSETIINNLSDAKFLYVRADDGSAAAGCPIITYYYDDKIANIEENTNKNASAISDISTYSLKENNIVPLNTLAAGYIEDNGYWYRASSENSKYAAHYELSVNEGELYRIDASSLDSVAYWLTENGSNVVNNTPAPITGAKMVTKAGMSAVYKVPEGATYLAVMASYYSANIAPTAVVKLANNGIDLSDVIPSYIVENAKSINIQSYTVANGMLNSLGVWQTSAGKHIAIPVTEGDKYVIHGDGNSFWGWVTDAYSTPVTANSPVPYVSGYFRVYQKDAVAVTVPSGAAYLILCTVNGGGTSSKWNLYKVDSYRKRNTNELTKFRMASWNIGQFVYVDWDGGSTHVVPADQADAVALRFKKLINSIDADVLGICEYNPSYSASALNSRNVIFQCYKNAHVGHKDGANCNSLFSNIFTFGAPEETNFTVENENRYYLHTTARLFDENIHIVEAHLDHTTQANRAAQIEELINKMSGYRYVIIAGDFNTGDSETIESEIAAFTNAGFTTANGGYIGIFSTSRIGRAVDHIMVKGFAMSDIQVVQESDSLSDHMVVYCDLTMLNI